MSELSENELNKVYNLDCLEGLKIMPDNSVDSIVTDPPYGLSFMGKKWDYDVPSVEIWKECLRVLKPGGMLLSFAGTRTQHRMACNIEDAGFEIRDMIAWIYGCLSEDTEILTLNGWERYNKNKQFIKNNNHILIYDIKENIFKWERPKRWQEYSVDEDTCYRIKSNYTDQLVSRNHNCLVERDGKLIFVKAEELQKMELMPILQENNIPFIQKKQRELLFKNLLWKIEGLVKKLFRQWEGNKKPKKRTEIREKSCLERRSNIFQKKRKLWKIQNKIYSMSTEVYKYVKKGWICYGTQTINGTKYRQMFVKNGNSPSYRPQSREQQYKKSNVVQVKQRTQNLRGYDVTKAKITKEKYTGIIYCPTVSTKCFVARRNGNIFITGNSGFPKSHSISKAVDKMAEPNLEFLKQRKEFQNYLRNKLYLEYSHHSILAKELDVAESLIRHWIGKCGKQDSLPTWNYYIILKDKLKLNNNWDYLIEDRPKEYIPAEREVIGKDGREAKDSMFGIGVQKEWDITAPATPEAQQWEGWGTALKPALEPITVARKPLSEKTVAANVLKHGTGGINIDSCRVGTSDLIAETTNNNIKGNSDNSKKERDSNYKQNPQGRFPANLIHDDSDEVLENFPYSKGQQGNVRGSEPSTITNEIYGKFNNRLESNKRIENEKSAARFFYCVKASKKDRGTDNKHPTVKPIKLMKYLCRLVTQPNGIILDPFMGSGTTGIAAKFEGFNFIGFERDKEYCKLANDRIRGNKDE